MTGEPQQPLEDPRADLGEPRGRLALEHRELESGIPLDRELVGRDRREQLRQLLEHPPLVDRLDHGLVIGVDEGADRRQRRRQANLEAEMVWKRAVTLEPCEQPIRRERGLGEAKIAEAHLRRSDAGAESELRQRPVRVVAWRSDDELRKRAEDRVLPKDPVGARAGFAVGDPAQPVAEFGRDVAEYLLGAGQRHAAGQVGSDRDDVVSAVLLFLYGQRRANLCRLTRL